MIRLTVLLASLAVVVTIQVLGSINEQTITTRGAGAAVASVLSLLLMSAIVGCAATWRWRGRWTGTLISLAGVVIMFGSRRNLDLAPPARAFATFVWLGGIIVPAALIAGHPDGFEPWTKLVLGFASALTVLSAVWVSSDLRQPTGVKSYRFPDTSRLGLDLHVVTAVVLMVTVLIIVFRRWRSLTPAEAPFVRPVIVCGSVWAGTVTVQRIVLLLPRSLVWNRSGEYFAWSFPLIERGPTLAAQALVFAFGFVTLIRPRLQRLPQGTRIVGLDRLPEAGEILRRLTGDQTLRVAFAEIDADADGDSETRSSRGDVASATTRWVDGSGHPFEPSTRTDRASTTVLDRGRPIALIEHDISLAASSATLVNAAVVAGSSIDVQRMSAATHAHLLAVGRLTRRLVETEMRAREKLHDDLSAGPCVDIERAARCVNEGVPLASAIEHLRAAVEGVRRIAHGFSPPELVDRGLRAALPFIDGAPAIRLPRACEVTAYLAVRNDPAARMTLTETTLEIVCSEVPGDPELLDRISALAGRVFDTTISLPFESG